MGPRSRHPRSSIAAGWASMSEAASAVPFANVWPTRGACGTRATQCEAAAHGLSLARASKRAETEVRRAIAGGRGACSGSGRRAAGPFQPPRHRPIDLMSAVACTPNPRRSPTIASGGFGTKCRALRTVLSTWLAQPGRCWQRCARAVPSNDLRPAGNRGDWIAQLVRDHPGTLLRGLPPPPAPSPVGPPSSPERNQCEPEQHGADRSQDGHSESQQFRGSDGSHHVRTAFVEDRIVSATSWCVGHVFTQTRPGTCYGEIPS